MRSSDIEDIIAEIIERVPQVTGISPVFEGHDRWEEDNPEVLGLVVFFGDNYAKEKAMVISDMTLTKQKVKNDWN